MCVKPVIAMDMAVWCFKEHQQMFDQCKRSVKLLLGGLVLKVERRKNSLQQV